MNFYLDFEATRFSNRIISIGCAAENGNTFYTLVKPVNKAKVDRFITELTGITNEMLQEAPSADEAFNQLFDFIELNNNDTMPKYFCYGNSDEEFIEHTVRFMTDARACICAQAIKGNLIDYAQTVKKFFVLPSDIALRKVYMLIKSEDELTQRHDALEDAIMLQTIVQNLYSKCKPEDKETILSIPSQKRPTISRKRAPQTFLNWTNVPKWEAATDANEECWMYKAVDQHSGDIKYFNDAETAALWVIKYIARNVSPKSADGVKKIQGAIVAAATETHRCRYNCFWEYNAEGAISCVAKSE